MKPKCVRTIITALFLVGIPAIVNAQASCATASSLTPGSSCSPTTGNLKSATGATPAPVCGSGTAYSVWYKFTAAATTQMVTINNFGSGLTGSFIPYLEIFSGTCAGLTSLNCVQASSGTASITQTGLTISTVYYIRVYTTTQGTGNPTNQWNFDICVQSSPANDDCAGATSLTPATSCSNIAGSLILSTATTGLPAGCESGGTHYDVWYKFVAGSTYELISISSLGSNFTNPEIQLYSGSCGSLTSVQCGTTSMTATGLTVGNTYYVRVSNVGSAVNSNGSFNICVYHPSSATYDYGKSYVNITRGTGGGTISPGDTLEIRGTLVIRSQTLDSVAFYDTLYNAGGTRLVPGSIALRTNEGKVYKAFTDAAGDDAGYRYTNGSDTVIRINMGSGASSSARGKLLNTSKPSVFGSTCIIMATYRVVVYAGYGSTINVGGGMITIKDANTGISSNLNFSTRNAIVYSSPGLCPNAVSATNAIGGDFNGTFGTPSGGTPLARNRGTSINVPSYIYKTFSSAGGPNDYYYGIANNTSGSFSTSTTWSKPDNSSPSHRIFNVWDITGDHTGATNTSKGNPPCDTTKPVSATNPCGYMLIINSAYKTDTAFQYTVTNLCPNTYYEISAWLKNICYKCGCDSNGTGASGAGYIPFATNDSSGVQPNLAFDINGTDYYTTGNLPYLGIYPATQSASDSTNSWVKRGFTYLTGTSQTSLTLTIRNNAPGGGGNDWAIDDITLATCLPNMNYSPSLNPATCKSNPITINDTVRSYFNNYTYYKWQRSTDGGTTWTDVTAALGPSSPTWNGTAWEYITSYTISNTTMADSGNLYRVVVATTSGNLSNSSCLFTDGVSIISLKVLDCSVPLKSGLLSFNGKLINNRGNLSWAMANESENISYDIEKSYNGTEFTVIGNVNGRNNYGSEINYYSFVDPEFINGKTWYRITLSNAKGEKAYSRIIQLSKEQSGFELSNVINPFSNHLFFDIVSPDDSKIDVTLTDLSNRIVKRKSYVIYSGVNSLEMENTGTLSPGVYILLIQSKENMIQRKVLKQNK